MAAVRHLGFVKFEFFNGRCISVPNYGDIAIFVIFQDGGRRHFGFSKIRNFHG